MWQWLSRRRLQWTLIILSVVALGTLAQVYRATIKGAAARVGLRIAAPFVRDLTAPAFSARDREIEILRSENAARTQDVRRLDELRAAQSQELESIEALRSEIAILKQQVRRLDESRAKKDLSPNLVPVVAMFDDTSLYSKGDRIEIYGASLKQTRSGPILIKESVLKVEQQRALVAWWPRYSDLRQATHARIRLSETNRAEHGTISLVVKLRGQAAFRFAARLGGPAQSASTQSGPNSLPSDIAMLFDEAVSPEVMSRTGNEFLAELPLEFRAQIAKLGTNAIDMLAVVLEDSAGNDVNVSEVSLVRPQLASRKNVTLSGSLSGQPPPPGAVVKLVGADGAIRTSRVSSSSSFVFKDVPKNRPVSVRLDVDGQEYFADQGRWIVPSDDMGISVHVEPAYTNSDHHKPDPSEQEFHMVAPTGNPSSAFYAPHSRQRWNGNREVQEFDSFTFSNNWGFLDRDRFVENPENCFRIVHLGSSHAVALQVPVAQKYNILLEEELGLKLGRCVEVLSVGRDNGDLGANFPRVRDYAVRFKPELIIFENHSALLMQLHPFLMKRGIGWDPEKNALDRIVYGSDGRMRFQPLDYNYPLYATAPDKSPLVPGVGYEETLHIEWNKLPKVAQETFRYMVDIVKFYRESFPGMRFVLQGGIDQAQCAVKCADRTVQGSDGSAFKVGVESFLANLNLVCRENALECINLPLYRYRSDPKRPLVFARDRHLNVRGHQWLARELADQIASTLSTGK